MWPVPWGRGPPARAGPGSGLAKAKLFETFKAHSCALGAEPQLRVGLEAGEAQSLPSRGSWYGGAG